MAELRWGLSSAVLLLEALVVKGPCHRRRHNRALRELKRIGLQIGAQG